MKKAIVASRSEARELSRELRTAVGPFIGKRRGVIGLSLVASGAMGLIALYQTGILRHLPDLPGTKMNADEVDAAPEAYRTLRMPDAVLGLVSYGVTMTLAAMGGTDRWRTRPWIPLALAGKVAVDAANAGKLSFDQWSKHRAFCLWCLAAAAATFATVPLALPEAKEAWRVVKDGE